MNSSEKLLRKISRDIRTEPQCMQWIIDHDLGDIYE